MVYEDRPKATKCWYEHIEGDVSNVVCNLKNIHDILY
jgi:hypothetical protein